MSMEKFERSETSEAVDVAVFGVDVDLEFKR